jgi:adenine-specific DNA-methyltransferase
MKYKGTIEKPGPTKSFVAEPVADPAQQELSERGFPAVVRDFPQLRFMGSKVRLLPWIHRILSGLTFDTAIDAFSGSGCVAYLLKAMAKQVATNDFLNLSATIARALIENPGRRLSRETTEQLLAYDPRHRHFIERTFRGVFFTASDLRFLDRVSWNIRKVVDPYERALALSALIRSCVKRQPRGVFTVAGDPEHYKDGRRDLKLSLREHFLEQITAYNEAAFDNGRPNRARVGDVFGWQADPPDLVYMDPPYVPRADDNCYAKRYHFVEGLSCYWDGMTILEDSQVKKIVKPFTPFSYRRSAREAFDKLFRQFADSILVLSYSSNGYPDLPELRELMHRYKPSVGVFERSHRYHFGTHAAVKRAQVQEYLMVGT